MDEFSGSYNDYLTQPLVNQPGEVWEYGINIDWAGQLVERASGLKLNDYFLKHILTPMGIKNINMFPTAEMQAKLAWMNIRSPDGSLSLNPDGHLNRRPLYATTKEEIDGTFQQGGAGCFARPAEYCQIIAMLLNDGVHPGTGSRILKKETVDQMFTNQVLTVLLSLYRRNQPTLTMIPVLLDPQHAQFRPSGERSSCSSSSSSSSRILSFP